MSHDPIRAVLSRLQNVQAAGERQWSAQCPGHDDAKNSLCVSVGADGRVLMHDQAGCATEAVLSRIGLKMADLFPHTNGHTGNGKLNGHAKKRRQVKAVYHYTDENGTALYDVVRFEPKDFRQGRPKPDGKPGWDWSVNGARRVIYRLSAVAKADPSKPVWIVEGEKDVDALERWGLLATTNAGGAGKWLADYNESLRGRRVIILPDNDDPGRKHAQHVASSLHEVAQRIRVVELPGLPPKGDVSGWIASGGTLGQLNAIVRATPDWQRQPDAAILHDVAAASSAQRFGAVAEVFSSPIDGEHLAQMYLDDRPRHVLVNSMLHFYRTGCYFAPADAHFRAGVRELTANYVFSINEAALESEAEKPRMYKVTAGLVSDVIDAIKSRGMRIEEQPPLWLRDRGRSRNCLVLGNGILDIDRLIADGPEPFFDHTPDFFATVRISYGFDKSAACPTWLAFLQRNLEADAERIAILQEFFGYCLTPDTSFHAFLLMHGEGSNGKSVVCSVLRGMLGDESVSTVPLEVFGEKFQLNATLGRLANIAAECGEIDRVAEGHIKSFVSGDAMTFERKFRDPIVAMPSAKLVLATNSLPRIADRSEGIWRRVIVMPFNVVIGAGERVRGMDSSAWWASRGELPGVLNWAIEGLRRLRTQGRFTVSRVAEDAREEFRTEVNPARQFLLDRYHANPAIEIGKDGVYAAYKAWCEATGHRPLADGPFGKEVLRTFPSVKPVRRQMNGSRTQIYVGLEPGATKETQNPFDSLPGCDRVIPFIARVKKLVLRCDVCV